MNETAKLITNFYWFHNIDQELLSKLLEKIPSQIVSLSPQEQIHLHKTEKRYLYLLIEGSLKSELLGVDGKVLRIRELHAPDMIGIAYLFNSAEHFPFLLTVVKEAKLLRFSQDAVLSLLNQNKLLLENFLLLLSDRLLYLMKKIEFLNFKTIRKKIAFYLLSLDFDQNNTIELPLSIENLSQYFGVERPSLSKVLGDFQNEKLIHLKKRGTYVILHRQKLISILDE
jgi:CRP-like cAMP-binding protein